MLSILYQDNYIVVCEKPVGAASEGRDESALPMLLTAQLGGEIHPVHRLDQAVGGVMVYARTPKAAAVLSATIQSGSFQKEYAAVLPGKLPEEAAELHDLLFYDRRRGKSFVVQRQRAGVKDAALRYRVVGESGGLSLVRVRLLTGRTHQIRVQFASRGLPLLGDGRYGSREKGCTPALWSVKLRFPHPRTGEALCFTLRPPVGFPWDRFDKECYL